MWLLSLGPEQQHKESGLRLGLHDDCLFVLANTAAGSIYIATCTVSLHEDMGDPLMGADTPPTSITSAKPETNKAHTRWALQRARRRIANLDRDPLPPDAPDASPVEARARRFG